eukprot:GHVQ01042625.1.p1 GENE.GHVQ01042625.1~~GHVQ01042625.1.p1  ORF type:complete len:150 (-),score=25.79 GHVQ01042625.1:108-557(-)
MYMCVYVIVRVCICVYVIVCVCICVCIYLCVCIIYYVMMVGTDHERLKSEQWREKRAGQYAQGDIYDKIESTGCADMYEALENCVVDHDKDWRKCQQELHSFRRCCEGKAVPCPHLTPTRSSLPIDNKPLQATNNTDEVEKAASNKQHR